MSSIPIKDLQSSDGRQYSGQKPFLCRIGLHKWDGCICTRCKLHHHDPDRHSWSKDCRECSLCGEIRVNYKHQWSGCKCISCSVIRDQGHDWSHDCKKCFSCGKMREVDHILGLGSQCVCRKCNSPQPHKFSLDPISGKKTGACLICGYSVPEKERCEYCGENASMHRGRIIPKSKIIKLGSRMITVSDNTHLILLCNKCVEREGICKSCFGSGGRSFRPNNDQILAGAMPYYVNCVACEGFGYYNPPFR
jgi:hypothetical protein